MYKLSRISYFIILLLIVGCSNNDRQKNTNENHGNSFLKYYLETFKEDTDGKEKMYIIIPCSGCPGCEQKIYSLFTKQFLGSEEFNLIICNPGVKGMLSPELQAKNIKYDFLGKMAAYDFGYGYPSAIIVKNNQVEEQYTLSPDIIHWIITIHETSKAKSK